MGDFFFFFFAEFGGLSDCEALSCSLFNLYINPAIENVYEICQPGRYFSSVKYIMHSICWERKKQKVKKFK
jgi:hypothetical protein